MKKRPRVAHFIKKSFRSPTLASFSLFLLILQRLVIEITAKAKYTKLSMHNFCFSCGAAFWAFYFSNGPSRPLFRFFKTILQKKLLAPAWFKLGSSELKVSMLTIWPQPPRPQSYVLCVRLSWVYSGMLQKTCHCRHQGLIPITSQLYVDRENLLRFLITLQWDRQGYTCKHRLIIRRQC